MSTIASKSSSVENNRIAPLLNGSGNKYRNFDSSVIYPEVSLGMGLTVQIVWLIPYVAADWLMVLVKHQRKPKRLNLDRIMDDMREGHWTLNGETIIFNDQGFLVDGSHRCRCVVETGVPIPVLVIRGVSEDAEATLNGGTRWSGAETLTSEGYSATAKLAASAIFLLRYQNNMLKGMGSWSYGGFSNTRMRQTLREHPGLVRSSSVVQFAGRLSRSASAIHFCHYILSSKSPEDAKVFFEKLATGEELLRESPILTLRNRLLSDVPFDRDDVILFTFKAWNAFRQGRKLMVLKWMPNESFPHPV